MSENQSGKFPTVFGYIAESERIALQRCVLDTSNVPGEAMEVGSLNGLSALLILSVLHTTKTLYCIEKGEVQPIYLNFATHSGFHGGKTPLVVDKDFYSAMPDFPISFIFIDHSHTHADNIAAFDKFWPLVSLGGILAFHDYRDPNWADGTRAIDELIAFHSLKTYITGGSFISFIKP